MSFSISHKSAASPSVGLSFSGAIKRKSDNTYFDGTAWTDPALSTAGPVFALNPSYSPQTTTDTLGQTIDWTFISGFTPTTQYQFTLALVGSSYTITVYNLAATPIALAVGSIPTASGKVIFVRPTLANGLAPVWVATSGHAYILGSLVTYSGAEYQCTQAVTPVAWSNVATYVAGQVVTNANVEYVCKLAVTIAGTAPGSDATHWQVELPSTDTWNWTTIPAGAFAGSTTIYYQIGLGLTQLFPVMSDVWTGTPSNALMSQGAEYSLEVYDGLELWSNHQTWNVGEIAFSATGIWTCTAALGNLNADPSTFPNNFVRTPITDTTIQPLLTHKRDYIHHVAGDTLLALVNGVQARMQMSLSPPADLTTDQNTVMIVNFLNEIQNDINCNYKLDSSIIGGTIRFDKGQTVRVLAPPNNFELITASDLYYQGRYLDKADEDQMNRQIKNGGGLGANPAQPRIYSISGHDNNIMAITVWPIPDKNYFIDYQGMLKFPKLINPTDTALVDTEVLIFGAVAKMKSWLGEDATRSDAEYNAKISTKYYLVNQNFTGFSPWR